MRHILLLTSAVALMGCANNPALNSLSGTTPSDSISVKYDAKTGDFIGFAGTDWTKEQVFSGDAVTPCPGNKQAIYQTWLQASGDATYSKFFGRCIEK